MASTESRRIYPASTSAATDEPWGQSLPAKKQSQPSDQSHKHLSGAHTLPSHSKPPGDDLFTYAFDLKSNAAAGTRQRAATVAREAPQSGQVDGPVLAVVSPGNVLLRDQTFVLRQGLRWTKEDAGVIYTTDMHPVFQFTSKSMSMKGKQTLVDVHSGLPVGSVARSGILGCSRKLLIKDASGEACCSVKRSALPPCLDTRILITQASDARYGNYMRETAIPLFMRGNPGQTEYDILNQSGNCVIRVRKNPRFLPSGFRRPQNFYLATVAAGVDVAYALLLCQTMDELFQGDRDMLGGL